MQRVVVCVQGAVRTKPLPRMQDAWFERIGVLPLMQDAWFERIGVLWGQVPGQELMTYEFLKRCACPFLSSFTSHYFAACLPAPRLRARVRCCMPLPSCRRALRPHAPRFLAPPSPSSPSPPPHLFRSSAQEPTPYQLAGLTLRHRQAMVQAARASAIRCPYALAAPLHPVLADPRFRARNSGTLSELDGILVPPAPDLLAYTRVGG